MQRDLVARRPSSDRTSGLGVSVLGMLLIASTYGMARFGVGLFAPRLASGRPALAEVVGWAAAAQFASYALAAAAAGRWADRRPRTGLVLAGATSAVGCIGVAAASTPAVFVASVFVGGMGAGFASPSMVRVMDAVVSAGAASTAQALVNSGTAVGVVGAGVLAMLTTAVAPAWVVMALACGASAGAVLLMVRDRAGLSGPPPNRLVASRSTTPERWGDLVTPGAAALVVGSGSALVWTFGPVLATRAGPVEAAQVGWLWVALGIGGLGGLLTAVVVDRLGCRRAWGLFAAVLASANVALAVAVGLDATWLAFVAMALFGTGYMCLSGVLILWARTVWPSTAGAGTSVLFIALAVGQALGSVGFQAVQHQATPIGAVLVAASLCLTGGLLPRSRPCAGGGRRSRGSSRQGCR